MLKAAPASMQPGMQLGVPRRRLLVQAALLWRHPIPDPHPRRMRRSQVAGATAWRRGLRLTLQAALLRPWAARAQEAAHAGGAAVTSPNTYAYPWRARRFQVDEVIIRGRRCKRVDVGHSMRLAAVDISGVPSAQVRRRRAPHAGAAFAGPACAAAQPPCCECMHWEQLATQLVRRFALGKSGQAPQTLPMFQAHV